MIPGLKRLPYRPWRYAREFRTDQQSMYPQIDFKVLPLLFQSCFNLVSISTEPSHLFYLPSFADTPQTNTTSG